MMLWWLGVALANEGIPFDALPVLVDPVFLVEGGWSATVADGELGSVRVFVGADAPAAEAWFTAHAQGPRIPLQDAVAMGNGSTRMAFTRGTVAVTLVRPAGGALGLAEALLGTMQDAGAWPEAPTLVVDGYRARIDGTWANVSWSPTPRSNSKTLLPVPIRVIPLSDHEIQLGAIPLVLRVTAWDRFGRAVRASWPPEPP